MSPLLFANIDFQAMLRFPTNKEHSMITKHCVSREHNVMLFRDVKGDVQSVLCIGSAHNEGGPANINII